MTTMTVTIEVPEGYDTYEIQTLRCTKPAGNAVHYPNDPKLRREVPMTQTLWTTPKVLSKQIIVHNKEAK